ncbi:MAG TPA: glutamyl-tRNA reductase [Acidimicrobiales bacterium]|nr:glutamyl-tRNA reductase [Acidimicrobiales bacterium]
MSVVVIGMNHRTAPLDLLERTAVDEARLPKVLHDLCARTNLSEAVVLSTCNRIEVYAVAEKFHGGYDDVRNFFVDLSYLPPEEFAEHLYVHYDEAAAAHLFGVAAGLDSAVLGESEILGQVRTAWERARDEGTTGFALNLLFRQALEVGKRVRTETGIGRGITSVAQAAVAMASDRLGSLEGRRVLLLGAGEMGEGMAASLTMAGVADVVVANRTWKTAKDLAARTSGRAVRLADVGAELVNADVLLTSTGASTIMLEHADLASAMGRRDDRPLLIVDIAMPRDVDPAAGALDGVTLLDMDDLRRFVAVGVKGRQREAAKAKVLVDDELQRYNVATTAREAAPLVTALREHGEAVRAAELARLGSKLADLDDRERAAVDALTKGIVAKLLHEPTLRLKDAAGTAKGDRLADALRDLFDL